MKKNILNKLFIGLLITAFMVIGWAYFSLLKPVNESPISIHSEETLINNAADNQSSPLVTQQTIETENSAVTADSDSETCGLSGYQSKYGTLPQSLSDIQIPSGLQADSQGCLIIQPGIRDVFEFFIAGIDEEGRNIVIARIKEYIEQQLPPQAAAQATQILDQYVAYNDYLIEQQYNAQVHVDQIGTMNETERFSILKDALQSRMDARRQFMDTDVINVFFAKEEAYDDYSLKLIELNLKPNLTSAEQEAEIEKIEALLPEPIRKRRKKERLEAKIQLLLRQGGNEELIHQLRTEIYGSEVADRWTERDRKKAAIQY